MIVKFKILRGMIKINNRITNLNFRRADLGLFILSLETALESRGAQESWLIFKAASSEHKNVSFSCAGSGASVAAG